MPLGTILQAFMVEWDHQKSYTIKYFAIKHVFLFYYYTYDMEEKDKIYRFQSLLDESDGSLETIGSAMGLMSNPTQKT